MSTPNDYAISPMQVKACKAHLDRLIAKGASQLDINAAQISYDNIVETWKQTFPDCSIPE